MSQNIDLEKNGKIFPSWVLFNFDKFELPEIIRKEGEDPCNVQMKKEITLYQNFLGQFLNYRSPFKDILVYHGLGSGKTVSAINIYNVLFNYTPKWNVFLLIKASLKDDPWLKDLNDWLEPRDKEKRLKNIYFVNYDSPYADRSFLETVKKADSSKANLYIFDEVHNFIRNVYNNISSKKGKRAQIIYDYIQQEKKDDNSVRIVLLSATPVVNNPYEFALIYNLLRPGIFPTNEAIFNQIYISTSNYATLNKQKKNQFQRRIMGLTSYYIGATPDKYALRNVEYINVVMEKYQEEIYNYFESVEEEKEKIRRKMSRGKVGDDMSTYASYTRQACNFVFPNLDGRVNGEKRPRPGQFKISTSDAVKIDEGRGDKSKIKKNLDLNAYVNEVKVYIIKLIEHFKELHRKDKDKNFTLKNDVKIFLEKYKKNVKQFIENEKHSNLLNEFIKLSPKMVYIIFYSLSSKGPVLIYSNYVQMEGLQVLKIYMEFFGYISFDKDVEYNLNDNQKNFPKDNYRYIEFHGGIEKSIREKNRNLFNKKSNKHGKLIKIILLSPAGAEGINLRNVRQVHILEPYWNEVRIEQVIGRAIRQCHHSDLPMEERKVTVYRYKMIRSSRKITSDEMMENISRKKNNLLISFIEAVKEVSVDCELFKAHNMMGSKYSCFKFEEDSLFDKNLGPAFDFNYDYDNKMDDGSNSVNSSKIKIKTRKIKAVKKINDNNYSKVQHVWYYDKSHTVYDYDLYYPIGKLQVDENNVPVKLESDIYIIDKLIQIPTFKLFN
uniref:Helicase n=1 Tax=Megaviridae environmental sample TaxID=1737588 RepID=A0A5J6VLF1_9VIRU|nr:MAG: helicase [Megaviridae environmental sample]